MKCSISTYYKILDAELYNFEDWQEIEIGTYQNYKLMADIDFLGRTNINRKRVSLPCAKYQKKK